MPKPRKLPLGILNRLPKEYPKEDFYNDAYGCEKVLKVYRDTLRHRIDKLQEPKEVDYDSPSWAHKQAHINGKIEAYQDVLRMLPQDPDEE